MALLIPILKAKKDAVTAAISEFAPLDWESSRQIQIFAVDDPRQMLQPLCEYGHKNNIDVILLEPQFISLTRRLTDAGFSVHYAPTMKHLLHGGLEKELLKLGLHWRSKVVAQLGRYIHGAIGDAEIDHWLAQFETLGADRGVGEHLLKLLDVPSEAELGDSLSADTDFYGEDLIIGFSKGTQYKSWTVICNLISKRCAHATVLPIAEAINNGRYPRVLRLVEDGLFSGTEVVGVLDSLLGTRPEGRTPKVDQMSDPSVFGEAPTQLYFGAVCDFGMAILRRYLHANGLNNVHIYAGGAFRKIRVLRSQSDKNQQTPEDNTDKAFKARLLSRVDPFAFQDGKGWRDEAARDQARLFCQNVGAQLWQNYIPQKPNFDQAVWPRERIELCSLGQDGLGLTIAFAHTVPKVSLPVYWASGTVTLAGRTLIWRPLFPNAESVT